MERLETELNRVLTAMNNLHKKISIAPGQIADAADLQKEGRDVLNDVYRLSQWTSPKYIAGLVLQIPFKELDERTHFWILASGKLYSGDSGDLKADAESDLDLIYKRAPYYSHRKLAGKALDHKTITTWFHDLLPLERWPKSPDKSELVYWQFHDLI